MNSRYRVQALIFTSMAMVDTMTNRMFTMATILLISTKTRSMTTKRATIYTIKESSIRTRPTKWTR